MELCKCAKKQKVVGFRVSEAHSYTKNAAPEFYGYLRCDSCQKFVTSTFHIASDPAAAELGVRRIARREGYGEVKPAITVDPLTGTV